MIRNGEVTLSEVKRILRRYWWIPTLMTVALSTIGLAASLVLPKKYTSTTLVLVEQPTVPVELIKPVVTDDLNQRMASMKAQVLSRSRLEAIITKFNLFAAQRATVHMDDLIEKLRKDIEVELVQPMSGVANRQPLGFNVSVTFDNPQLAQQICQEITSAFIERNATARVTQSKRTTDFLTEQLEAAKANLDQQDKKLAQFKAQYLVLLPDQEQTNLALLGGLNTQLDATTQALNRAQQDKTLNEALLGQQEANWKASLGAGQTSPETQEQQLDALQEQLTALLAKYTPEHPDVIKVQKQIEDLKKKLDQPSRPKKANQPTEANQHEPPAILQQRAKIKQDEMTIVDLTKRQGQIQEQIRTVQGRLQASPVVEQQLKELTRNYQTASDIYNDLLKKRDNSEMATQMESQEQGESFKVLDAPSFPSSPSFPKKIIFVGGGLGAGLALSFGILYLLAMSDKAMYSERDVELCLKLPVLTLIPSFEVAGHGAATWRTGKRAGNKPEIGIRA